MPQRVHEVHASTVQRQHVWPLHSPDHHMPSYERGRETATMLAAARTPEMACDNGALRMIQPNIVRFVCTA